MWGCHSDALTVERRLPNLQYPRVPGHEVIGKIDALGEGVVDWSIGQRVAVGYLSSAIDGEDALSFSVLGNVRPMIETVPLAQAGAAYARVMQGEARFRMVLVTGQ